MPDTIDGQLVVGFNPIVLKGDKGDPGAPGTNGTNGTNGSGGRVDTVTAADATMVVNSADPVNPTVAVGAIDASKVTTGTVGTARLGSGTPSSTTYLRGDQTWATIAAGGTVTSVTAGNGTITIGGTTAAPTVAATVGTAAGTVAAGNDSRITGAIQSGAAAGGDLSGTLPSPTVAKINGTSLAALATGILRNTTTTGVPTIATAAQIPVVAAGSAGPLSATDASVTNSRPPNGAASGDLTGTYPSPTLAATAVTAGSYTSANITVDTKGRITAAASGAATSALHPVAVDPMLASSSNRNTGGSVFTRIVDPGSWSITKLGVMVGTSAGNIELAVFRDNGSGAPGTLASTTGSVACPAAGVATVTLVGGAVTVNSGDWLAFTYTAASAPTFGGLTNGLALPPWRCARATTVIAPGSLASNPTLAAQTAGFVYAVWGE